MSTNHTPTPWKFFIDDDGKEAASIAGNDMLIAKFPIYREQDRKVDQANAAYIVKAVNCHDQLVAALEDMMEWARAVSDEYIDGGDIRKEYRQSLADARAALAAAGAK